MASICNDDWASLGVMSGHERKTLRLSARCRRRLARIASPSARVPDCKLVTVQGTMPRDAAFTQTLCADTQRFSLHAAVRFGANKRKHLGQRCRYITRPALANERVQCKIAGQVVLKLRTAWRDGTTHRGGHARPQRPDRPS